MAETMYEAPGIGLAATQVDVHKRVIVIDASETRDQLLTWSIRRSFSRTACRSARRGACRCPAFTTRSSVLNTSSFATRISKARSRRRGDRLLAVCLQHEIDHLQGRVFVEHLSQLKQVRIKNKLAKQARITA
jgi:peptide deformylase